MDSHRVANQNTEVPHKGRTTITQKELAWANQLFDVFLNGSTLKTILGSYRTICESLHLKPNVLPHFYPKLRANLITWRAKALWKKFDLRANNKVYGKGKLCPNTRVLIIGAGPCGLRTAIEAQLLGAKVVVIEKRDRMSRNNVLHLWPFVIDDLRLLGAKKFFGKFCAGAIDHISIRQLQCILLKVALLLGVEVHTEVSFERLVEPNPDEKTGWRAEFKPSDHPVSQYEFDVIIGADGKRNTLQGFRRKEFRGKLAIAITANFINKRTEAEARVEEISGVAFIFNQKFFKDLFAETGIDLENIVYYKDDTHYFVMTAKKASLIEKGVIRQDLPDTAKLLAPENVDREALMNYAREAAEFSTNYNMLNLEFAVNHYGQPDVAMFDFTSMYAAENASRLIERHGYKLLTILVGDSLLEPFWPTGSGCARGFLSSLDAAWAIRAYGSGMLSPLEVIAERESIYRLLAQTTPENLNKDYKGYTLDPSTRYPNLNKNLLTAAQVLSLFDTDDPKSIEITKTNLAANHHVVEAPKKRRRRDSNVDSETLVAWIKDQVKAHEDLAMNDITTSLKDGRVLCAIINHYRPDLLDYSAITADDPVRNNKLAFEILEKDIGIPPVMTGEEMANSEVPDYLTMVSYLTHIYDMFRCEIPHIKHPKLELPEPKHTVSAFTKNHPAIKSVTVQPTAAAPVSHTPHRPSSRHKRHSVDPPPALQKSASNERKPRKRKTMEKFSLTNVEDRMKRLEEIALNRADRHSKRRQQRKMQTDQFIKSMQMLQSNCKPDHSEPFEDYSIFLYRQTAPNFEDRVKDLEKKFTYVPERENRAPSSYNKTTGEKDEDFQARIKGIEDKWSETAHTEKKPKDLLRAIGKIDNSDWNIKEIEKKIHENKLVKVNRDKERVPKWSREQFLARQTKMEKQHLEKQDSTEAKYAEIDKNIKQLDQKLKEGTVRDLKQKKVAMITEKFVSNVEPEPKPVPKSNSKAVIIPTQGNSEACHFCSKKVYLMERLSAEGRFFHRGCFRCQYCHTALRLGSYLYDRDGKYGYRFFCSQHFGMPGELKMPTKVTRKPSQRKDGVSPEKKVLSGVAGVDLLDRVQTPERIEFANLSTGNASSDHDDSLSQMDEDEWTDRNFGASTAELGTSDDDSSSMSDTDSDDEDAFEEALDEPPTKEGTLKWAELFKKRYSKKHRDDSDSEEYSSSDPSSYYENSSGDDDSDTATEGEEEIRARELRKQEVRVDPPVVDTGTDTEIASDETSSTESSSEIQNSATEISTDSEFAHDDPTPTREVPSIVFNDAFVTKTRGKYSSSAPQKVQIRTTEIQKPLNTKPQSKDIELKFTPLVLTPIVRKPAPLHLQTEGYALNRTQSTGGIATKVSLELKKRYLLGESNSANSIQKSGSASTLDSKLKSFHSTISDCQKLLKPAAEASASMQTLCSKLNERSSPVSPIMFAQTIPKIEEKKIENTEENSDAGEAVPFENENEGRPRSPVHETSIIVPQIDWSQQQPKIDSSESSSESSSDSDLGVEEEKIGKSSSVKSFSAIPTLEVQDVDAKDLPIDSLNYEVNYKNSEPPKSICGERKTLNQPKTLPILTDDDSLLNQVHAVLHNKSNKIDSGKKESESVKNKDKVESGSNQANEKERQGFEAKLACEQSRDDKSKLPEKDISSSSKFETENARSRNNKSKIDVEQPERTNSKTESEYTGRTNFETERFGSNKSKIEVEQSGRTNSKTDSEYTGRTNSRIETECSGSSKSNIEIERPGRTNEQSERSNSKTKSENTGRTDSKSEIERSGSIKSKVGNEYPGRTTSKTEIERFSGIKSKTANEYSGSNNKFKIANDRSGRGIEGKAEVQQSESKLSQHASKIERNKPETPIQLSPYKSKLKLENERAKLEDDRSGSGRSTPSNNDPITAVLTETELSDWAREGAVSDDLDDEFEPKLRHHKRPKTLKTKSKSEARKAVIAEFDELSRHVCGKARTKSEPLTECVNSILHPNLDNIEFMDTGSESSEDEVVEVKNNGYIQFHDEDDIVEDSLSPVINVVEAKNPRIKATFDEDFDDPPTSKTKDFDNQSGFCNNSTKAKSAGLCNDLSTKTKSIEHNEITKNTDYCKSNCPDYSDLSTVSKNTGYCIIGNENENFGGEVIDLKPTDLELLKEKRNQVENEEDSLLIIETGGTTTEENTCSDSTVKNITQITPSKEKQLETSPQSENNNIFDNKRLEDKLAQVKKDMKKLQEQRKAEQTSKQQIVEQNLRNNIEFEQHCQRLQSRVDFGNARDSIDIRKSRRQSKGNSSPTHPKPDLIQEEKEPSPLQTRREQLEKERDMNKKLVQEMVMNKMKAQNKSLERKRRSRNSFSPARPCELTKSTTTDNMLQHLTNPTPDVLLSTLNIIPVQKSQTVAALSEFNKSIVGEPKAVPRAKYLNRPLSVHSAFLAERGGDVGAQKQDGGKIGGNEAFSLPDIQKALVMDQFQTPKVPPRLKNEEAKRVVEKLKDDARARAKLLSDEDLGLSPEDKLARLRQRVNRRGKENDADVHVQDSIESLVVNTERRNSLLYSNDTLKKKKNNSFRRSKSGEEYLNRANSTQNERERTKSVSDLNKHISLTRKDDVDEENKTRCFNKSDPNLLEVDVIRREKKKPKDRERRKSITKMFTDLFSKKKDAVVVGVNSNGNKGFLARISPKAKDKSKVVIKEEQPQRRMSFTELRRSVPGNVSPPPIPPLPLNYTGSKSIEDSSDNESDYKRIDRSSCDTLDQSGVQDGSICSRRSSRSKRAARQSQLKRHRMAQEIQRKLEETEVKMRELELRGVYVEKALRGECDSDDSREETDMLKEWFDLMRDMTELKRYERELNVRAQELELEDRHARLQHDLKERLEIDGQKSREDIETEGSIIKEMMDIVRKRDSLITLLEEDRQRYSEEDKGFEEQMLAKGINLTPILTTKVTEK